MPHIIFFVFRQPWLHNRMSFCVMRQNFQKFQFQCPINLLFKNFIIAERLKCCGIEDWKVVAHGCRKTKNLYVACRENVLAYDRLPSPARLILFLLWFCVSGVSRFPEKGFKGPGVNRTNSYFKRNHNLSRTTRKF